MSWPAHTSDADYITARIKAVYPTATVYNAEAIDMNSWLQKQAGQLNSYLISYEGWVLYDPHEGRGTPMPRKIFSVYWHGREMGGEGVMDALVSQINTVKTFTIASSRRAASVTGGRYLLIDRGFDTYQLDIEIK